MCVLLIICAAPLVAVCIKFLLTLVLLVPTEMGLWLSEAVFTVTTPASVREIGGYP
jgi:hypothetical protein